MIGRVLDIVAKIQSDYTSAADNKEAYDQYQRFFKSPPYEKTSVSDFTSYSFLNGRLGGCLGHARTCLRNLRVKVDKTYAKIQDKVSQLRKNNRNGN